MRVVVDSVYLCRFRLYPDASFYIYFILSAYVSFYVCMVHCITIWFPETWACAGMETAELDLMVLVDSVKISHPAIIPKLPDENAFIFQQLCYFRFGVTTRTFILHMKFLTTEPNNCWFIYTSYTDCVLMIAFYIGMPNKLDNHINLTLLINAIWFDWTAPLFIWNLYYISYCFAHGVCIPIFFFLLHIYKYMHPAATHI